MSKLTDTQLVILSAASRRVEHGVDPPTNVTDEAVRTAVDELIRAGMLEEVRAKGSLLAWRRDAEAGPMAPGLRDKPGVTAMRSLSDCLHGGPSVLSSQMGASTTSGPGKSRESDWAS